MVEGRIYIKEIKTGEIKETIDYPYIHEAEVDFDDLPSTVAEEKAVYEYSLSIIYKEKELPVDVKFTSEFVISPYGVDHHNE